MGKAGTTGALLLGKYKVNPMNMSAGTYKLCYRAATRADTVEQTGILLQVTDSCPDCIKSVSISEATVGNVTMTYTGTFAVGDKYYWEPGQACDASKATSAATAGSSVTMWYVFSAVGPHKLCLKSKGKTDAASQVGVSVKLSAATPTNIIQTLTPATTPYGTDVEVTLTGATAFSHHLKILLVRQDVGCAKVPKNMSYGAYTATTLEAGAKKFTVSKSSAGDASNGCLHVVCAQLKGSIDVVEQKANSTHATRFVVADKAVKNNVVAASMTLKGIDCADMAGTAMQNGFRSATAKSINIAGVTADNVMTKGCKAEAVVSAGRRKLAKSAVQDFTVELPATLASGKTTSAQESLLQDIAYGLTSASMASFKTALIEAVKAELGANHALSRMESDLAVTVSSTAISGVGGKVVAEKVVESGANYGAAVHAWTAVLAAAAFLFA